MMPHLTPLMLLGVLALVLAIALLYSAVGHGGGSGYLAVLALLGVPASYMATTALTLNLFVAGIGLVVFLRAGHFSGRATWPFLVGWSPAAFLGGLAPVSSWVYATLLAAALAVAAWRLLADLRRDTAEHPKPPAWPLALALGGGIGWLSGVIGVGGGIFLSPLMLLWNWATPKQTAASSACFIFINSAAALAGRGARGAAEFGNPWLCLLVPAALVGGLVGSRLGANHFSGMRLKQVLALVLLLACAKLLMSAWHMS
jgi:uncharacterized membrane protein YfcA